jgi:hypothetical protein
VESLLLFVTELAVSAQQNLQEAGQVFFTELLCDAAHARTLVCGNL